MATIGGDRLDAVIPSIGQVIVGWNGLGSVLFIVECADHVGTLDVFVLEIDEHLVLQRWGEQETTSFGSHRGGDTDPGRRIVRLEIPLFIFGDRLPRIFDPYAT